MNPFNPVEHFYIDGTRKTGETLLPNNFTSEDEARRAMAKLSLTGSFKKLRLVKVVEETILIFEV